MADDNFFKEETTETTITEPEKIKVNAIKLDEKTM